MQWFLAYFSSCTKLLVQLEALVHIQTGKTRQLKTNARLLWKFFSHFWHGFLILAFIQSVSINCIPFCKFSKCWMNLRMSMNYRIIRWNLPLNVRIISSQYCVSFLKIQLFLVLKHRTKEVEIRRGHNTSPFVVTVLRWHHSHWVFNLKTFP